MGSKRKKSYYKNSAGVKKYKGAELQSGAVGFLISFTKDRDRQAKAESYELLNAYAEGLGGGEERNDQSSASSGEESEEDIEAAMQKQLTKLKQKKLQDKFSYLLTGVNQMLFMKAGIAGHHNIIYRILDDAKRGELKCQSRSLNRILPVLSSCRAEMGKIGDCVLEAISIYLTTENLNLSSGVTYKALVKVRNNNQRLSQREIISEIGVSVREGYPSWSVDLSDPGVYVVVDVLKTVCCVSVVHGYSLYKKFNLHELVADHQTAKAMASCDGRVKGLKGTITPTEFCIDASVPSEADKAVTDSPLNISENTAATLAANTSEAAQEVTDASESATTVPADAAGFDDAKACVEDVQETR